VSHSSLILFAEVGIDTPIPLVEVSGVMLVKIVEYCKQHIDDPVAVPSNDKKKNGKNEKDEKEKRTDNISDWDLEFCNIEQSAVYELILAANYLNIKGLLDLMCKTVANWIKGKTPDEIRKTFNITKDFTAEEEAQIREDNEWGEDL